MPDVGIERGEVFLRVGRGAMHLERGPALRSAHLDRLALHPIRHCFPVGLGLDSRHAQPASFLSRCRNPDG